MKLLFGLSFIFWTTLSFGTTIEALQFSSKWKGDIIPLKAELQLPDTNKPVPVVIIQHSSGPTERLASFGGYTDSIGKAVGTRALQQGYAVIYTDVFTPRNVRKDSSGDLGIGIGPGEKDIKQLMRTLIKDNRFDHKNIFLFGHSYGGGVAVSMSYAVDKTSSANFNAILASAPGCQAQSENKISVPLKIIIGETDDWTPPAPCVRLINRQATKGAPAEIEIVKGVNHSYSYSGTWDYARKSRSGCMNDEIIKTSDGKFFKNGAPATKEELKTACIKQGATAGGNSEKLEYVVDQTLSYFNSRKK
jgi:dienelactone hydrolase